MPSEAQSKAQGKGKAKHRSSWTARDKGAAEDNKDDYLAELGKSQNYNINVSHGMGLQQHHCAHCRASQVQGSSVVVGDCLSNLLVILLVGAL